MIRLTWLADVGGVLRTALRLWVRHWPALIGLASLGVGLRAGVLWLAIHVRTPTTRSASCC